MRIDRAYLDKVEQLGLLDDPVQYFVVDAMQVLQDRILEKRTLPQQVLQRLRAPAAPEQPLGLYLWGGVGRGKTFLMDLFFESLAIAGKRRVHFHRLMSEVHGRLKDLGDVENPLDRVAEELAKQARVLCFDEFFVSDIGDAMILSRLLEGLFHRDVILVATSNSAPADLYRNGLQRERFLPAIALLERYTRVLHMDGDTDYRLKFLQTVGTFISPAGTEAQSRLNRYFHEIASGFVELDATINICDRNLQTKKRAKGVVWFDFQELCDGPRSTEDYIEIARRYQTVIVSDVPSLGTADENAARRFIALVDEFYDRRVKLILSAAAKIESIYCGRKLAFEFERTVSRLFEMQSTDYLHAAHLS